MSKRSPTDVHTLPELQNFRWRNRRNLTPAEAAFWNVVKASKLDGRKFRRQHSVGRYILDFYCPSERIAVELDGEAHFNGRTVDRDRERSRFLESVGIRVIRFENRLVFDAPDTVKARIREQFGWWRVLPE